MTIQSKPPTKAYRDGWDLVFGPKEDTTFDDFMRTPSNAYAIIRDMKNAIAQDKWDAVFGKKKRGRRGANR